MTSCTSMVNLIRFIIIVVIKLPHRVTYIGLHVRLWHLIAATQSYNEL